MSKQHNINKMWTPIGELVEYKISLPLKMIWDPKEDITAHELALCLPYFFMQVAPNEIDYSLPHFRHFKIINPNIK